jgi:hypothetical protein
MMTALAGDDREVPALSAPSAVWRRQRTPTRRVAWFFLSNLLAATGLAQPAAGQRRDHVDLRFGKGEVILAARPFGDITGVALGKHGAAYILDEMNQRITKVDSTGRFEWQTGREGHGPGEYEDPYRIAARPDGGVAVLDWRAERVTLLSPGGSVDATFLMPFHFTQLDGFDVLPDGRFVIAGMTYWGGTAKFHSVHVFTDSLQYRYSFGRFAEGKDSEAVRYVGSGGIALDPAGNVLLTLKRPYEIDRFDPSGRLLQRTPVAVPLKFGLDDLIVVTRTEGHTIKSIGPHAKAIQLPFAAHALPDGGFIGGQSMWDSVVVALISATGDVEASVTDPAGCVTIAAIDVRHHLIYCKALNNDEPEVERVRFSLGFPRR